MRPPSTLVPSSAFTVTSALNITFFDNITRLFNLMLVYGAWSIDHDFRGLDGDEGGVVNGSLFRLSIKRKLMSHGSVAYFRPC